MSKRVFLGVPVEPNLASEIEKWMRKKFRAPNVRFISANNMHLTLVAPWYEDDIDSVIAKLKGSYFKKFTIKLDNVSFGPDPKHPRLIWSSGEAPIIMLDLKQSLEVRLDKRPEKRQYLLHLTIARFNQQSFINFKVKDIDEKVGWKFEVDSFCLYESKLKPTGAEYSVLSTFSC